MKQIILIIFILIATGYTAKLMFGTEKKVIHTSKKQSLPTVQTQAIKIANFPVFINSSGIVTAHNKTNIVSEVAGRIIQLSPNFIEGGYIKKGELLASTDRIDFINKIKLAQAELDQQQLQLKEALTQQNLAQKNWKLFGDKSLKPTAMAMKKPLVASAKAAIRASTIRLEQTKLELTRTQIRAPYNGRVESKEVSIGQFISRGSLLGKVFSTDFIEIKLPVSNYQYELLNKDNKLNNKVTFYRNASSKGKAHWQGTLTRTSPSVDKSTRQISLVATIQQPFRGESIKTLNIGEYLQAEIAAKTLRNIIILPSFVINNEQQVLLSKKSKLSKRKVNILYQTTQKTIISRKGFSSKDRIITTPLPNPIEGMLVRDLNTEKAH